MAPSTSLRAFLNDFPLSNVSKLARISMSRWKRSANLKCASSERISFHLLRFCFRNYNWIWIHVTKSTTYFHNNRPRADASKFLYTEPRSNAFLAAATARSTSAWIYAHRKKWLFVQWLVIDLYWIQKEEEITYFITFCDMSQHFAIGRIDSGEGFARHSIHKLIVDENLKKGNFRKSHTKLNSIHFDDTFVYLTSWLGFAMINL